MGRARKAVESNEVEHCLISFIGEPKKNQFILNVSVLSVYLER